MSVPVFIDAAYAAELLHISPDAAADLIRERGFRTYGGPSSNPFVRSADILALIDEIGVKDEEASGSKRLKSGSSRVQTRLTADARWVDVEEDDIRSWLSRADSARKRAARTAAENAMSKLSLILALLDQDRG
ncbi:MAG TPA: hypothetical protein VF898_14370 [Chloroflexota bacterium]